jgi:hypothetical protein
MRGIFKQGWKFKNGDLPCFIGNRRFSILERLSFSERKERLWNSVSLQVISIKDIVKGRVEIYGIAKGCIQGNAGLEKGEGYFYITWVSQDNSYAIGRRKTNRENIFGAKICSRELQE